MKDNLFEMLLGLFEASLSQLQERDRSADQDAIEALPEDETSAVSDQLLQVKPQHQHSTRVFTYEEQMKLTKASYQFLMRMTLWNIIDSQCFEVVMNQLQCSDSRIVTLQETKWTIRNILSAHLSEEQLAFLDLVMYQAEDELTVH